VNEDVNRDETGEADAMNLIPKTTACDLLTVQAVVSHMQCKSYASHQFTNRTLVMIHFVSKLCEASLLSPLTSCSRNDITIRHHMRAKENFYTIPNSNFYGFSFLSCVR